MEGGILMEELKNKILKILDEDPRKKLSNEILKITGGGWPIVILWMELDKDTRKDKLKNIIGDLLKEKKIRITTTDQNGNQLQFPNDDSFIFFSIRRNL
jgi:hypothetical protein